MPRKSLWVYNQHNVSRKIDHGDSDTMNLRRPFLQEYSKNNNPSPLAKDGRLMGLGFPSVHNHKYVPSILHFHLLAGCISCTRRSTRRLNDNLRRSSDQFDWNYTPALGLRVLLS